MGTPDKTRTPGRALLAVLTSGTSEIKTGAGEYGDETVADALFPKEINNFLLDREASRNTIDATRAGEIALGATAPRAAPDLADKLLQRAGATSLERQQSKQGRRSAFLTGGIK